MEMWKKVIDFPEYEVSTLGNVRRAKAARGATVGKLLKPYTSCGYLKVYLISGERKRKVAVHRIVLETFIGQPTGKLDCCHWNGIRTDNRLENLRWASRSENMKDAKRHGTLAVGERHGHAKLTVEKVQRIRELRKSGIKIADMAEMFNVSSWAISDICTYRNWKHI